MEPGIRLRRALWSAVIFLAMIGVAVATRGITVLVPVALHLQTSSPLISNPRAAQFAALDRVFADHPVLTLVHVIPGLLFMLLGPLQFSASIRARHIRWHRWSGRIFLVCSVIIGVSALVMSFAMHSIGGVNQAAATILFGTFFLIALGKAFWHIRRQEIAPHREWMIRAFAIGLAVATIRPIIGIFFATSRWSGLTPVQFFGTAFWIGFVVQLIAAECWIHATQPESLAHGWQAAPANSPANSRANSTLPANRNVS